MKYIRIISVLSILLFLSACQEDTTSPSEKDDGKPGRYIPLQLGAEWEYEYEQQGSTSKLVSKNDSETQINGLVWIEQKSVTGFQSGSAYYRYEDGKYYQFIPKNSGVLIEDLNIMLLDENAEVGTEWEVPHKVMFTGSSPIDAIYTFELSDKFETYEVNGKTYSDVVAVSSNLSYIVDGATFSRIDQVAYFAADIGLIKMVGFQTGVSYSQYLIDYSL